MHPAQGTIRLGVAGLGRAFERLYLPALKSLPGVEIAAAFDPEAARDPLACRQVRRAPTFDALLGSGIDSVIVLSPPRFHGEQVAAALAAGLPVLVEKPPALTLAELEPWLPAPGNVAAVTPAFARRYWPPYLRLRQEHVRVDELSLSTDPSGWGSEDARAAGPEVDLLPHLLDLSRWVSRDDIVSVTARRGEAAIDANLALSSGNIVRCLASHSGAYEEWVAVAGKRRPVGPPSRAAQLFRALRGRPADEVLGISRVLRLWLRHLHTPSPGGLRDAWAVVAAMDAARESADAGGKPVAVRPFPGD